MKAKAMRGKYRGRFSVPVRKRLMTPAEFWRLISNTMPPDEGMPAAVPPEGARLFGVKA